MKFCSCPSMNSAFNLATFCLCWCQLKFYFHSVVVVAAALNYFFFNLVMWVETGAVSIWFQGNDSKLKADIDNKLFLIHNVSCGDDESSFYFLLVAPRYVDRFNCFKEKRSMSLFVEIFMRKLIAKERGQVKNILISSSSLFVRVVCLSSDFHKLFWILKSAEVRIVGRWSVVIFIGILTTCMETLFVVFLDTFLL